MWRKAKGKGQRQSPKKSVTTLAYGQELAVVDSPLLQGNPLYQETLQNFKGSVGCAEELPGINQAVVKIHKDKFVRLD